MLIIFYEWILLIKSLDRIQKKTFYLLSAGAAADTAAANVADVNHKDDTTCIIILFSSDRFVVRNT